MGISYRKPASANVIVLPAPSPLQTPPHNSSTVASSTWRSASVLPTSQNLHQQNAQSPIDISATQVVRFPANNYIIPNTDIPLQIDRPFRNIPQEGLRTDLLILNVCSKYISKEGCDIKHCFRFHVCHNWIRNICSTEDNCSFEHNFQGKGNAILYNKIKSQNFGEEEIKDRLKVKLFLKEVFNEDCSSYICMDFLLKQCERNDCVSHHLHSRYSWQFFHKNSWYQFSRNQNEMIEKYFCDSSKLQTSLRNDESSTSTDSIYPNENLRINFKKMSLTTSTGIECCVRRISTPSDLIINKPLATRWLWYWNDDDSSWNFYTNAVVNGFLVIPFSDYIETQFLKKIKDFTFKLNPLQSRYTINFEEMTHTNQNTGIKRDIRRRPMHSQYNDMSFTSLWSDLTPKEGFLLQEVPSTSPEFSFIHKMIADSLPVKEIFIQRVENSFLWEAYQLKKAQMMLSYGNDLEFLNEQYMFHGTSNNVIDKICAENFDWRLYASHVGSLYGKGTYFANNAKLSNYYASIDVEKYKWIFVALVLVGKATVGNSKMTIPPIDPITNKRFDSTVDKKHCPQIFAKYNPDEYYPAYLVKYKT